MESKLGLDGKVIDECRTLADRITEDLMGFIRSHTTDSVERAVTRLLGLDGKDRIGTPYPNVLVDAIKQARGLRSGVALSCADLIAHTGGTLTEAARAISERKVRVKDVPELSGERRRAIIGPLAEAGLARIAKRAEERDDLRMRYPMSAPPLLYVIVATGNIYEDVTQARSAVSNGADCIAVIRSTAQSLLDYVPFGATTEGFGGTYATQENFRIMRAALDECWPSRDATSIWSTTPRASACPRSRWRRPSNGWTCCSTTRCTGSSSATSIPTAPSSISISPG